MAALLFAGGIAAARAALGLSSNRDRLLTERERLRHRKAAEVPRQAGLHRRGLVQPGHRGGHVTACADREEAGQSLHKGVGGVPCLSFGVRTDRYAARAPFASGSP
jgi:hypothetical protein